MGCLANSFIYTDISQIFYSTIFAEVHSFKLSSNLMELQLELVRHNADVKVLQGMVMNLTQKQGQT